MSRQREGIAEETAEHGAELVPALGKAGSPTPSERRAIYRELLRRGEPPPGWKASHAKKWGIHASVVGIEINQARLDLEASRTPEAVARQAHELIQQSIEAADEIDKDAEAIDNPEKRARIRAIAVGIKLKSAAELRQLYSKATPGDDVPGLGGLSENALQGK